MAIRKLKFDVDENDNLSGVKVISLVESPAIESDVIYFNKDNSNHQYIELKAEGYKNIVAGLALIPNKYIYRVDASGTPYYGWFSEQVIEKIRNKFHKELLTNRINTDHNPNDYVDGFLIESYIIDSEERLKDVQAKGIKEAIKGSWYVAYKIEDQAVFNRVVKGELNGFSVEAFLQNFYKNDKANNNNNINEENIAMTIIEKLKALLAEEVKQEEIKMESATATDSAGQSVTLEYGAEGEPVNIVAADGSTSVAPDDSYTLDSGVVITVASGVATSIVQAQQQEEVIDNSELEKELETAKEDKKKLEAELASLKAEFEKLKKQPVVKPISKKDVKVEPKKVDFSKLSNAEKFLYKHDLLEIN